LRCRKRRLNDWLGVADPLIICEINERV